MTQIFPWPTYNVSTQAYLNAQLCKYKRSECIILSACALRPDVPLETLRRPPPVLPPRPFWRRCRRCTPAENKRHTSFLRCGFYRNRSRNKGFGFTACLRSSLTATQTMLTNLQRKIQHIYSTSGTFCTVLSVVSYHLLRLIFHGHCILSPFLSYSPKHYIVMPFECFWSIRATDGDTYA